MHVYYIAKRGHRDRYMISIFLANTGTIGSGNATASPKLLLEIK